jgi:SAM-dependent methyltransferase
MSESIVKIAQRVAGLTGNERILLMTPGPQGAAFIGGLLSAFDRSNCVVLDSDRARLKSVSAVSVRGRAVRLPFLRHSFGAVLSFESLYAIRPPWTVLAEFHRVLIPDGVLLLLEPAGHGIFSALRDRVAGPGKRIFTLDEVKSRLARGDYTIDRVEENLRVEGFRWPAYAVRAIKKENPAEPVPQYKTAREMIAARKKKMPEGEELP